MQTNFLKKNAALCLGFSTLLLLQPYAAKAIEVEVPVSVTIRSSIDQQKTRDLNFGTIDVNGEAIVNINAKSGDAVVTKTSGKSVLFTPGTSHNGEITVSSAPGMDFTINITYDDNPQFLGSGNKLKLEKITINSTPTGLTHKGGTPSKIRIGGQLSISSGVEDNTYSGTTTVTLDYN